jgi:5-methylcytosine-specific restriction endonuclease McrA
MRQQQKPKAPKLTKTCFICGALFQSAHKAHRTCSKPCSVERGREQSLERDRRLRAEAGVEKTTTCGWCGEPRTYDIRTSVKNAYHPDCRKQAKRAAYRIKTVKRQGLLNPKRITHESVVEKYGSDCHICQTPIDLELPRTHKQGLTLDHVVPLSKGGVDEMHNLRPAHWICNIKKSAKSMEELDA